MPSDWAPVDVDLLDGDGIKITVYYDERLCSKGQPLMLVIIFSIIIAAARFSAECPSRIRHPGKHISGRQGVNNHACATDATPRSDEKIQLAVSKALRLMGTSLEIDESTVYAVLVGICLLGAWN